MTLVAQTRKTQYSLMDNPLRAVMWSAASALFFSLMSVCVKLAMPTIPHFELVFFRSLINLLVVLPFVRLESKIFLQKGAFLLFVRGLGGFGSLACLFYSIEHLPLAIASLLSWCSPLFVVLFSRLFLSEKLSLRSLLWIGVTFSGVVLLAMKKPGEVRVLSLWGVGLGLFGAACAGLAMVAIRAASSQFSLSTIIFCFVSVSTLISAPLAYREFKTPHLKETVLLLGIGLFASLAQYMMTHAYQLARAGLVSTVGLTTAVHSAFFGWVFFHETLFINQWLGIGVIGVAIALLVWENSH